MGAECIDNWSCQQCIYGGSDLQCKICSVRCMDSYCFKKECYSYFCSDSLRAYQCYYESIGCQKVTGYPLKSITSNCKQCALDDQDVDACYVCYNACFGHSCWNNC